MYEIAYLKVMQTVSEPATLERLKQEMHDLINMVSDRAVLAAAWDQLRAAAPPPPKANPNTAISFDADGKGYTALQLGDTLDARVEAMRRGEGVLTMEEFNHKMDDFWETYK